MTEKLNSDVGDIIIVLTSDECEVLKIICMEVLGNYRWKTNKRRALVLNNILDQLEEAKK
jgi:hypothetical protein